MRAAQLISIMSTLGAGCAAAPERVRVELAFTQDGVPANVLANARAGGAAWFSIIGAPQDADLPVCAPQWWLDDAAPCLFTVEVSFAAASELGGAAGLTDRDTRTTRLAYELAGDELIAVAAHEVGHSLWLTGDHLAPGEVGIMSAAAAATAPTDADRAFVTAHTAGAL